MTGIKRLYKGILKRTGIRNPLLKIKKVELREKTIKSVGGFINHYGIFELVQPSSTMPPCLCTQVRNRPVAYLNELEIPNQQLRVLPVQRVPWLLCREPREYGTQEYLFQELTECLYTHLELPKKEDLTILTSWVMMTWITELYDTMPYLFFYGAFETGKTRALEMLQHLAFCAWLATNITEANLYRPIESWHPTVLLDETETFISRPEIIGLLNSGYKRGTIIPKQVQQSDGSFETEWFDVFCPKALAGTRDLPTTTKSRCITFKMTKTIRRIPVVIDKKQCANLRDKLLKWRFDVMLGEDVKQVKIFGEGAQKEMEALADKIGSGRLAELFFPLYKTAPANHKTEILTYATEAHLEKVRELGLSPEVICLEAILKCHVQGLIRKNLILFKDIADKINESLEYNEQWTSKRVSQIVGRLGFEKQRTNRGNALIWNERLIQKLKNDPRYKSAFQPTEIEEEDSHPPSSDTFTCFTSSPSNSEWLKKARSVK